VASTLHKVTQSDIFLRKTPKLHRLAQDIFLKSWLTLSCIVSTYFYHINTYGHSSYPRKSSSSVPAHEVNRDITSGQQQHKNLAVQSHLLSVATYTCDT